MLGDNYITASGVILSRQQMGENSLWVRLFLNEYGIMNVSAPSGRRGFGGDNEPFMWGVFYLQKKSKSSNYYLYDIEARDDMYNLRKSRETMTTALKWTQAVTKYLSTSQPDDELLRNLYWSMKLLCYSVVPPDASDWRFFWHWLEEWGLAPDIVGFHGAMKFTRDEIILLAQLNELNTQGVIQLFSSPSNLRIRQNTFRIAAGLAVKFLNEK